MTTTANTFDVQQSHSP